MNLPTSPDYDIEAELRRALAADAERISPEPALHRILDRAHAASPPRKVWRRRWLPVLAGGVATAGVVAAAVVIFAPSDETPKPAEPVPCSVEARAGCPVELALYYANPRTGEVVGTGAEITSTGNIGLDAVRTLLRTKSRANFANHWHGYDATGPDQGPIAQVNDVTPADGTITVDFDRELHSPLASLSQGDDQLARAAIQQLVLTVQSALRTDDPVLITVNGEPVDEAFDQPLTQPVPADWALVSGIRVEQPAQGATVSSPVTVSGTSSTGEANVVWEVTRDGEVVAEGTTMGGSFLGYEPFSFQVRLDPGAYTVKLYEPSPAGGSESLADELSVVYLDIVVE